MIKTIGKIFVLGVVATFVALGVFNIAFNDLYNVKRNHLQRATDAVVHIFPGEGVCSGVYIDDPVTSDGIQTTILTAKHCIRGLSPGQKVYAAIDEYVLGRDLNPETKPFDVLTVSKNSDLAILQTKTWVRNGPVSVLADHVDVGGRVYAVGYPLNVGLMVTEGNVWNLELVPREVAPVPPTDSNEFRLASIMVSPGNSGGPLYTLNAGRYEIVGVASMIVGNPAGSHIAFYTDLEDIREFLGRVKKKFSSPQPLN